jgi:hypothetical protein
MAEETSGSTVPRRHLGRLLKQAREDAGLKRPAAAKHIERADTTLWRVETGRTSIRAIDVKALCELYSISSEMSEIMVKLAGETKAEGWWQAYGAAVPEWFDLFVGLEEAARELKWLETELVPGILQTEDYARTLILEHNPDEEPAEIERRVQLRLERQKILTRPIDPPEIKIALREPVLQCPVGGPQVMAEQLDRLAEASELPNVELRVTPLSAGFTPGMLSGPFIVLRFPRNGGGEESEPPTVYTDLFTGALYLDKPHEVEKYDQVFAKVWDASLKEGASRDLVRRSAEEMRHG